MKNNIPLSISSKQSGSWAHTTVCQRLPEIAGRVKNENQFPAAVNDSLTRLQEEITSGRIRHLTDQEAQDTQDWKKYLKPYLGKSWLDVPWFFAETYFYRRIMESVGYFPGGQDPFSYQKKEGLRKSVEEIQSLGRFLEEKLKAKENISNLVREGLYFSLWGNQSDLSLWPAGTDGSPKHGSQKSLKDHLLANDIQRLVKILAGGNRPLKRVDLMLDNAGFELVADLALADILLGHNLVDRVILHVKGHPTFVSDVIAVDIDDTVEFLSTLPDQDTHQFSARLRSYMLSGRLEPRSHRFWNSPLAMWELPRDLWEDWVDSALVISKGDANYRRLLGDRQWDFTIPFHRVVDYLPVPLGALRTLKAELAVGMSLEQIQHVYNQDRRWMVNGRWGVIHYAQGKALRDG